MLLCHTRDAQLIRSGPCVCKVTFKHLPQLLRRHMQSFIMLRQLCAGVPNKVFRSGISIFLLHRPLYKVSESGDNLLPTHCLLAAHQT